MKKNKDAPDEAKNFWLEDTKTLIAFLLNLHNFTILYGLCAAPPAEFPESTQDWIDYSKSLKMKVGEYTLTPFEMQHSLVRSALSPPKDLEAKKNAPATSKARLRCSKSESLLNFGFYYPYKSSPALKVYTAEKLIAELAEVAQLCLNSAKVDLSKSLLTLPGFASLYKEDFLSKKSNKNFMVVLKSQLFENTGSKHDAKIAKWYCFQ